MKILVVAPQPFFTPRGTPFSVYYRTQVTCSLGHQVDLLAYGQGKNVDIAGCRIVRIPALRWLGQVRVGPSYRKVVHDCLMLFWTIGLLARHRYRVVHAHEEAVFWCRWLKPVFRFRLIYDMHSSLPQQLHNFEFTRLRFIHWLFERLETSAVRASDAIIVICPALGDHARKHTDDHDKILLIENSIFDPVRISDAQAGSGVGPQAEDTNVSQALDEWFAAHPANRVIAYAGTLEAYQGIDKLLESFALVARDTPDAGLLIVGGEPAQVEACRGRAVSFGIAGQVFLTGQLPQSEAQRLVGLAAACVSPRFSGDNTPLKIYQLLASGVPVIATRIESHTQVLNDEISILTGVSTGELAAGMLQALREPRLASAKAARAKAWYEENYSRPVYTTKMRALFALVS